MGISFPKQKDFTEILELLEEAKKKRPRNWARIGTVYFFAERGASGGSVWASKKEAALRTFGDFLKKAQKRPVMNGYYPNIGQKSFMLSGHYWKSYWADSFQPSRHQKKMKRVLIKKPMETVAHHVKFQFQAFSYRELTKKRICWICTVYRIMNQSWRITLDLHGFVASHSMTPHIFCYSRPFGGRV